LQVFGPPPKSGHPTSSLPQHGFARNSRWEFLGKSSTEDALDSESVKLDFGLDKSGLSEDARKAWPVDFGLVYSVTLSKDSLQTVITVRNEGEESFDFQFLLHTYFRIKVLSQLVHCRAASLTTCAGHLQGLRHRPLGHRIRRQGPRRDYAPAEG
jgi:glucose-6-phosphate 1-epimerase